MDANIKEKIEKYVNSQLVDLFIEWAKMHNSQSDCNNEKTGIAKGSFTPDGTVDEVHFIYGWLQKRMKAIYNVKNLHC